MSIRERTDQNQFGLGLGNHLVELGKNGDGELCLGLLAPGGIDVHPAHDFDPADSGEGGEVQSPCGITEANDCDAHQRDSGWRVVSYYNLAWIRWQMTRRVPDESKQ